LSSYERDETSARNDGNMRAEQKGKYRLGPIGIILRGSAFIFRKYDVKSHEVQQRLEHIVRWGQFFTPFIQRAGE
jgi:hypothetical protein